MVRSDWSLSANQVAVGWIRLLFKLCVVFSQRFICEILRLFDVYFCNAESFYVNLRSLCSFL